MLTSHIRHDLRRAVYGSFSEWRAACEKARQAGATEEEVTRVLFWWHPATWLWGGVVVFILVAILAALLEEHLP
jgi:hypothetical protein